MEEEIKMKKFIMLMITCIMITGCSDTKTQETIEDVAKTPIQQDSKEEELVENNEIETVEEMPVLDDVNVNIEQKEEQVYPLEISTNTLENKYQEEDALLAHVKIDYPIIQDASTDGLIKINQFFAESAQALYEENNTYASDHVEEIKEDAIVKNSLEQFCSEYIVSFEVKYNAHGYLSILEKFSEKSNGIEYENSYLNGFVFDVKTGERLAVKDIFIGTEEEIAQIIGQAFITSDKISEEVKNKYKDEILENTNLVEFCIDGKNVKLFYNPYTVASYSEGTLEAYIPLSTDNIFKIVIQE